MSREKDEALEGASEVGRDREGHRRRLGQSERRPQSPHQVGVEARLDEERVEWDRGTGRPQREVERERAEARHRYRPLDVLRCRAERDDLFEQCLDVVLVPRGSHRGQSSVGPVEDGRPLVGCSPG